MNRFGSETFNNVIVNQCERDPWVFNPPPVLTIVWLTSDRDQRVDL